MNTVLHRLAYNECVVKVLKHAQEQYDKEMGKIEEWRQWERSQPEARTYVDLHSNAVQRI